jgi:hypothetical protein
MGDRQWSARAGYALLMRARASLDQGRPIGRRSQARNRRPHDHSRGCARARVRGSIDRSRMRRSDHENVRGCGLRGGRSGGDVLCRGCGMEWSVSFSGEFGPSQQSATVVLHQGSLLTGDDGAGDCGKPRSREQDGPVQGKSRRGCAGMESTGSAAEYLSNSRSESDARVDRIRFEVTPCPQLARAADEGRMTPATRSMQNAPPTRRFDRSWNEETISTRAGEGATTWESSKGYSAENRISRDP